MQWFSATSVSIAAGKVVLLTAIAYVYGYRRGNRKLEGTLMPFVSVINIYIAIALGQMGGPSVLQIVFYIAAGWGFLRGIFILMGPRIQRDRVTGRTERPSTPSWIAMKNPHLKIMAMCPNTNKPVFTGVNSLHWELEINALSITFRCLRCGEMHKYNRSDTWLEQFE